MTQQQKASSTAWAEARKEFGEAVASALQDLLRQGFSRERATSVIFQQIGGEHDKPSDEQVFSFMRKHGLGDQQALLALTVSSACKSQFEKKEKGVSDILEGLRGLTVRVQKAPSHPALVDTKETMASSPTTESSNISLPMLKMEKNYPKVLNERIVKTLPKAKLNRKRVLETSTEASPEDTKRLRADSVSEEISAKVEEASSAAACPAPTESKVKSSQVIRSKRSRSAEEAAEVRPAAVLVAGKRRKSTE
mmetsp:Transcript_9517/g.18293  ORF Transcript_9517/g.18293 Transcript_9517/m.18293 type:complete len:251 (+) Transcript_9517:288-1040(+)